ncbi:Uncharacterized protein HZ326_25049, partial [Fusarium oxysporum f. sp. albedinis]
MLNQSQSTVQRYTLRIKLVALRGLSIHSPVLLFHFKEDNV